MVKRWIKYVFKLEKLISHSIEGSEKFLDQKLRYLKFRQSNLQETKYVSNRVNSNTATEYCQYAKKENRLKLMVWVPLFPASISHLYIPYWQCHQWRQPQWKHSPHPAPHRFSSNLILQIHRAEDAQEKNLFTLKRDPPLSLTSHTVLTILFVLT